MLKIKQSCLATLLAVALPSAALADFSYYLGIGGGGSRIERDDIDLNYKVVTTSPTGGPVALGAPPFSAAEGPPYAADPFIQVKDPSGTDFAYKLFAGVRYGANLGFEAGYIDLGTAEDGFDYIIPAIFRANGDFIRPALDRQITVETAIDGFQFYAVGFLPLGERFELFGKIGLIAWDRETKVLEKIMAFTPISQPGIPDTRLFSGGRDPGDPSLPSEPFVLSGEGQNLFSCFPSPVSDGEGGAQPRVLDAQCSNLLPRRSDSGTDLALGFGLNIKASENVAMRAEFEWFDIKGTSLTWASTISLVFSF